MVLFCLAAARAGHILKESNAHNSPMNGIVHGPEQIFLPFKGTNCEWYQIKVHLKKFQN